MQYISHFLIAPLWPVFRGARSLERSFLVGIVFHEPNFQLRQSSQGTERSLKALWDSWNTKQWFKLVGQPMPNRSQQLATGESGLAWWPS